MGLLRHAINISPQGMKFSRHAANSETSKDDSSVMEEKLCIQSPSECLKKKRNLNTSAKLAQARPDKYYGEADMLNDTSGSESPEELLRGWYVEGQIMSGVISPVLAQRCQETV
ncbi:hypothetical protein Tco_0893483 [Tanacetum coccineum]|uniref:Uncharacterized protein n=1 Tax=Tanacetum coccineum TaxID=301880 RepID=A0ABQ5C929_9ASTR